MQRSKIILSYIILNIIIFLTIVPLVKCNPVPIPFGVTNESLFYIVVYLPILLNFTILMEFGIILLFVKKVLVDKINLFKAVLAVNLFTFPITQFFALFLIFLQPSLNYIYLFTEIIPITLEILIFLKIFDKFLHLGYLKSELALNKKILSIFFANLITFLSGIIFSLLQSSFIGGSIVF
jgi:hypothetical protein